MIAANDKHGHATSDFQRAKVATALRSMHPDLSTYRASARENDRVTDLLSLMPAVGQAVLDAGARDGHLSLCLRGRFEIIVALDLEAPRLDEPAIACVQGDITALPFDDNTFDAVLCAEVLEHIPSGLLARACNELSRVTRGAVVVGVPYRQDLRYGRTTCQACGRENPPWGHVNSFDENSLKALFPRLTGVRMSYVGQTREFTNGLSTRLFRYAGNPYGTYEQDEKCVHCNSTLGDPAARTILQRCATRAAMIVLSAQHRVGRTRANWVHVRFDKLVR